MPDLKVSDKEVADHIGKKEAAAQARLQAEVAAISAAAAQAKALMEAIGSKTVAEVAEMALVAAAVDVVPSDAYLAQRVRVDCGGFTLDLATDMLVRMPHAPYRALFFIVPGPQPVASPVAVTTVVAPADVGTVPAEVLADAKGKGKDK